MARRLKTSAATHAMLLLSGLLRYARNDERGVLQGAKDFR